MKYHFKIHREKKGFWAQCIELKGCFTQANSMKELIKNMQEAVNLYIQEPEDSADLASLPDDSIKKKKNIIEVPLDPEIAFAFMVRYYRTKHSLTQHQAARLMGFEKIYSYQRLEGRRCNPTLKILSKVKKLFPDFSVDYALGC